MKIRIKFAKFGCMKFLGHLDVLRYFQKVLRRAEVDLIYTNGFSPHPVMSFASPLGVGLTSEGEYVDIEVGSTGSSSEMIDRLNASMVEGIWILDYRLLPERTENAMSSVTAADYLVSFREGYEPDSWSAFSKAFVSFMEQESIIVQKESKKGMKELDIRPLVLEHKLMEGQIFLRVSAGSAENLKPELLMQAFYQSASIPWNAFSLQIHRLELYRDGLQALIEAGEVIPGQNGVS